MKSTVRICLSLIMLFTLFSGVSFAKENEMNVYIKEFKVNFDAQPIMENNVLMVQASKIFTSLGITIKENSSKRIVGTNGYHKFIFSVGDNIAYIDGIKIKLSSKIKKVNGYIFVPLKTICNSMKLPISYDKSSNTYYINKKTENTTSEVEPVYFGDVESFVDTNNIKVLFRLYDSNKKYTSANGTSNVVITNDKGEILYQKPHTIVKSSFEEYTRNLTGQKFMATAIIIPISEIKKSNSSSGKISIDFSTNLTRFDSRSSSVFDLPKLSDQEKEAIANEEYSKTVNNLDIEKSISNYISVKIKTIGLVTLNDYSGDKKYIKVDLSVKNTGTEKLTFYPSPVILTKNSGQYEKSYVSPTTYKNVLEFGDIYPGVIKEGSMFFELEDNPDLDLKELIVQTGLRSYSMKQRNVGQGQSLLFNDEYVFSFDLSSVKFTSN